MCRIPRKQTGLRRGTGRNTGVGDPIGSGEQTSLLGELLATLSRDSPLDFTIETFEASCDQLGQTGSSEDSTATSSLLDL